MKKLCLLLLSLASINLEAIHFQSAMSVTPLNNNNEFIVEVQIEKVSDEDSEPELIASPKIICAQGKSAELKIESEDQLDLLCIQIEIPEDISQKGIQAFILMKEKGLVVLSFDNMIKLNN